MTPRNSSSFEALKDMIEIVPRPEIALEIAKAVTKGQYGQEEVAKQEPFSVTEEADRWVVKGTRVPIRKRPNEDGSVTIGPDQHGPVTVEISKRTGEVLFFDAVWHFPIEWPGLPTSKP